MKQLTFNECPRPQFVREGWISLDGKWDFKFDWSNNQIWPNKLGWEKGFEKDYDIVVPFAYQTKASGIDIQKRCDSVWYQKHLEINKKENKRYILNLEGADYDVRVFVNGILSGCNSGAYHRMSFDITKQLKDGDNLLVINCCDDYSIYKPRGKQRWRDESFECFYIDTTGIYKSVWLEEINEISILNTKITPNIDNNSVSMSFHFNGEVKGCKLFTKVSFEGKDISSNVIELDKRYSSIVLPIRQPVMLWDVNQGNLYDVEFILKNSNGEVVDQVSSYFGMRKIEVKDGLVMLNNHPLYQKLVLDQGYWLDSQLTPPNNKALYEDIIKMQQLGFNGCRKHEKFEDERFMYYSDVLGYLLWCEMPSMYSNTPTSRLICEREWMLEMRQAYNHPCIITWTIFNESWGINDIKTNVFEQEFVEKMYRLTKEFDPYRLAITNDGWEHLNDDLLTMHHYEQDGNKLFSYFNSVEKCIAPVWESHHKGAFADGYTYSGQPILMSEFAGTAYVDPNSKNWGYGESVKTDEEFIARLDGLFKALQDNKHIQGYCYTQVSDVQQEVNGLLYENREFKVNPEIIKKMQDRRN